MSDIADNLREIKKKLPGQVRLVAVSKTKPVSVILEAYQAEQRIFGENRVQELVAKAMQLPEDIEWHLIGHLQTNKVKQIAPFVSMIHSVDSVKLLHEISRQAERVYRTIDVLLQVHIAKEETKFGFDNDELHRALADPLLISLPGIRICGLMGMATFTDDLDQVRKEFRLLHQLFLQIKSDVFSGLAYFSELSMGMSGDYQVAIEEGSTLVRLGTVIFGSRN